MRRILILSLFLATPALSQDGPGFFERLLGTDQSSSDAEQGTLLERLIEDGLSGAGRVVSVDGFRGALSGEATLDQLTIADDEGVWLTLTDAVLDWNRSALFAGRLEVTTLSAGEILLPRLPESEAAPTPEATGFQIPELPVSVEIGTLLAEKVELGAPVIGRPLSLTVDGDLSLAGGDAEANLTLNRLDGDGQFVFSTSFANETQQLALSLTVDEAADGILAGLAQLPGTPALSFAIEGDAPLSDFLADIRLDTDGERRLAGQITISDAGTDTGIDTGIDTGSARQIGVDIAGDIAPIFAPAYQDFFGNQIALVTDALIYPDGRVVLPRLALTAQELILDGAVEIGADGLPTKIDLTGQIEPNTGTTVLLPLSGEETRVGRADLQVSFDAAQSEDWTADILARGVSRGTLQADSLRLAGTGRIQSGETRAVTADVTFEALGASTTPALDQALGPDLGGSFAVDWAGGPVEIPRLALTARDLRATGQAQIGDGADITGEIRFAADRLQNFAALAGRDLTGQSELQARFAYAPVSGAFTVDADGATTDLTVGMQQLDAVLQGTAEIDLTAARDEDGLRVTLGKLESGAARVTGAVDLRSGGSTASLTADLTDVALVLPALAGPGRLEFTGSETPERNWRIATELTAPLVEASVNGDVSNIYEAPSFLGKITAELGDLSAFSELAGRPLAGALALELDGGANADLTRVVVDGTATGRNLSIGQADVDRLLAGQSVLTIEATRTDARTDIAVFEVVTPALRFETSGTLGVEGDTLAVTARLADLAPFAGGLSGPLTVTGDVGRSDQVISVELGAEGPGGATADVSGTLGADGRAADLRVVGAAPLGLANRFIAPRSIEGLSRFDLAMRGPLGLSALSGSIRADGARLSAPTVGTALRDITGRVDLANGTARLNFAARVEQGGQLSAEGSVGLSAPNVANIAIDLDNVRLEDARLYETTAAGQVRVNGPIADGAAITGTINLGETNIRIPNSTIGGAGAVPEIVHINEPPPVRGTRRKAGLLGGSGGRASDSAGFPLDLRIQAPNRVFVRGRGLDSEFGGNLRLTGTTNNIVPLGAFNLIRGRLDILGRRLALEEARITMQGALVPFLNITATTQVEDTDINVGVFGPADAPEIEFSSSPDLPQEEVLARLLFGRGLETLSPLQAARLALAVRTLAGQGGEGLVGRIRGQTGLADLDVTTDAEGNAAVRAGAYLGENLYSDVTVGSTGETQLNLNLDVSPSLTVRGGVTNEGETSLGIFFERDY